MPRRLPLAPGLLVVWLVTAAFSVQPAATPTPRPSAPPPTLAPTPRPSPRPTAAPTPTPAAITLGAGAAIAGAPLTVGGSGFEARRQVTIYFDVPELPVGAADPDARGVFQLDIVVPQTTPAGMHAVCVQRQPVPLCLQLEVLAPATPIPAAALPPTGADPAAAMASTWTPVSPLALLAAAPVIALLAALVALRARRRLTRALRPGQPWTPPSDPRR
jgi:hypothetical protein